MGIFSSIGSFFGGPTGGLIGGIGDSLLGRSDAEAANEANSAQAHMTRDFQERMRGSAYQATVKDLQAAGLNPMLAYSNGATQTPGGAQSAPMQNRGLQSAQQNSAEAAIANTNADTKNKLAQSEQIEAQTALIRAQEGQTTTSTANIAQQTENLKMGLTKMQEEIRQVTNSAELMRQQGLTETDRRNLMNAQRQLADIDRQLRMEQISNVDAETKYKEVMTKLAGYDTARAKNEYDFEKGMETGKGNTASVIGRIANTARKVFGK